METLSGERMKELEYMDIEDFEDWEGKYNIGDMFVDSFGRNYLDSFGSYEVVSYIYRIEYEPNSKITYYWIRFCQEGRRDNYMTEEELDETITNTAHQFVKYYPVKK